MVIIRLSYLPLDITQFSFVDPLKTRRGFLHLKAYRLTPQAVALYKDNDFGAEAIKTHHLSFESLYQVK
jgi:hypothetical protein